MQSLSLVDSVNLSARTRVYLMQLALFVRAWTCQNNKEPTSPEQAEYAMDDSATERSTRLPALVAGFATLYLLWGSTYLGIKFAVETLPPLLMAGARFLISGSLLYLFLRWRGVAAPTPAQWWVGAWTGALLLLGGNGLVTWGQQTVPSGRAALLVATTPLWMVLLAWIFYKADRPTPRIWLGMLIGFLGTALLIRPNAPTEGGSSFGTLAVLLAPVAWSLGSLETRQRRPTEDILLTSAMQMLTGGAMMFALGSCLGEWPRLFEQTISLRSLLAFGYLTIFGGLVGFTTYAWLLRVASPTAVSTYAYVNPLVAVLLGWALAGESLNFLVGIAAAMILGAVVLITLPKRAVVAGSAAAAPRVPLWRALPAMMSFRRAASNFSRVQKAISAPSDRPSTQ